MRLYLSHIPVYVIFIYIFIIFLFNFNSKLTNTNKIKCSKSSRYSSYTCSGSMNSIDEWRKRTCRFHNICYNKTSEKFEFYVPNNRPLRPILFDLNKGNQYSFQIDGHGFVNLVARATYAESWAPTIIQQSIPFNVTFLQPSIHVLFMHYHQGFNHFNPGYFIWEDLASTYTSMRRMNVYNPKAVLMEYTNFPPNNNRYYQMYDEIVPAFADRVVPMEEYLSDYQCFQTLVVGGSIPVFGLDTEMYNHGKEAMLYEFRSLILRYHNINLQNPPVSHHIVLVNKSESFKKSKRSIFNLEEVADYLKKTYSSIPLTIVEWHKMETLNEQLKLIYSTTILITPSGGVSAIIPFLPRNAHAIIMDYYVSNETYDEQDQWKVGESASIDSALWNYFPHIRKLYYQIKNQNDCIFDIPKGKNIRHDASVIINVTRLKQLVDTALQNSS
jgi:hypothetical protein